MDWTGHPLVDVGLATLCAMTDKASPTELSLEDLDKAAAEMEETYLSGAMSSYLSCVFPNSGYVNPSMKADQRREYATRILRAHRRVSDAAIAEMRCTFCGEVAAELASRAQLPMLTGEEVLNFFPAARGGLPICASCLVAIQSLPLGGRRTEGRLLVVHSDVPEITLRFAKKYLQDNRRLLALAAAGRLPRKGHATPELDREQAAYDQQKQPKYPDAKAPTSLIGADLVEILTERATPRLRTTPLSISAYWLSNSGQGAALEIFHLPSEVVSFLQSAATGEIQSAWAGTLAHSWRAPYADELEAGGDAPKQRKKPEVTRGPVPGGPGRSRNDALADLFAIYENGFVDKEAARRFVSRHLLRRGKRRQRAVVKDETSIARATSIDANWINWPLASLFLRKVLAMDEKRIDAIKHFADGMADYVARTNDRGVFRSLVYGTRAWEVRQALTKAQRNRAKEHNELLFGLEDYIQVFLGDDSAGVADWSLTRDLISIRLVETLYERGFFHDEAHKELLVAADEAAGM
jgi:CRISPR-associated protein Cst1